MKTFVNLINFYFSTLSEYRILKTKCILEIHESKLRLKQEDSLNNFIFAYVILLGVIVGFLFSWLIFNSFKA